MKGFKSKKSADCNDIEIALGFNKKGKKKTVVSKLKKPMKTKSHPDIRQDKGIMWSFQM